MNKKHKTKVAIIAIVAIIALMSTVVAPLLIISQGG